MLFRDQVALVTGGGRGIGEAISLMLGAEGARVIVAARTLEEIDSVCAKVRSAGGRAVAMSVDISQEKSVARLFQKIEDRFLNVDIVVNNAGIGLFGTVEQFPVEELDRLYQVNLRGTFLCCQQAMRAMAPRRSGSIINIASVVGIKGYANQAGYTATKHAIMGLTKTLALEAQEHGIRVSAVLPGGVDTAMVSDARPDLNRSELLQPEDVADTVRFLLSLPPRAAIDEIYLRRFTSKPF
ncbi:MAG TPA: SDR family NAD(P)-dependent oxidoreductase [Armatimonadota bacterium]|jgi:3-oxoacyl-[acyl-carrier protein] reductase